MLQRVGIYARISADWEGTGLGVTRQRQDCQKLAALRGWEVAGEYVDNNISAFKSVDRPEFERLLRDLSTGLIDGIIAYDLDRISRRPDQLERIIKVYEQRRGLLFATVQGELNLSTSDGLTMARVMVSFANKASMDTSRRTIRKNLERAEAGLPHGSHRAFGYERDGLTVNDAEAAILKDMAQRVIAGTSYRDIAYWLNTSGFTTAQGKQWYSITVRNTLQRKRLAGIRTYKGAEYDGQWPAIYDAELWSLLQFVIRERRTKAGNPAMARKYLLTGLLICGKCGGHLNGETKRDKPEKSLRPVYVCRPQGNTQRQGGCGGVTRNAPALDTFIREAVIYRLDTPDLAKLLTQSATDHGRLRELVVQRDQHQSRLISLLDDFTDGTLSKSDFIRARTRVETALGNVEREIESIHRLSLNVSLNAGESVRQAWERNADCWRRRLIGMIIDDITVNPSTRKPFVLVDGVRMRFDAEAIDIKWRS